MAYIRLDSHALFHNLTTIQSHIARKSPATKLALVLKDNAYGHGLEQMAGLARSWGIESVFVKNYAEAARIESLFPTITALYGEVPLDASSNIWQAIPSLHALINCAKLQPKPAANHAIKHDSGRTIELKVNIGMHRNGIAYDELEQALAIILDSGLRLGGVFAHNGYGDNDDRAFLDSIALFAKVKKQVRAWCATHNRPTPRFHCLSTSGAARFYAMDSGLDSRGLECDDLVRIGIGAYGYHTSDVPLHLALKPVASLWARKIATQHLRKGDRIGYGGVSVVECAGAYSTYDVGYGDGLFRVSGKEGRIFCASGEEILPVMSMDCFSCQSEKQEICVFDDVSAWARAFGTLSYVILTHLSPTLPRVVV